MPVSNILNYAGILITSSGGYVLAGGASSVTANWDTAVQLWDGGPGKRYIFWGDTTGNIDILDFSFSADVAVLFTLITNEAYSGAALSIVVSTNNAGVTTNVMQFQDCVYNPEFINRKLRPMGDRLVLETGTSFRIIQTNV